MPNAHDYHDAAHRLRHLAEQLGDVGRLALMAADPDRFAGGPLATVLRRSLDAHVRAVEQAGDELARLASVCDRRAEICEQYAAELGRHRLRTGGLGPWSPAPAPPAWWVEA